jgi:hypothetical protein
MFKMLVLAIYGIFIWGSDFAFAEMKTVEKWTCSRDDEIRLLRLYAPAKGEAPCKVFYYKRIDSDPTDAQQEAEQNSGDKKPIYYSTGNGGFCVRKMHAFLDDRKEQGWACVK